jgi:hypothetical protein
MAFLITKNSEVETVDGPELKWEEFSCRIFRMWSDDPVGNLPETLRHARRHYFARIRYVP